MSAPVLYLLGLFDATGMVGDTCEPMCQPGDCGGCDYLREALSS